MINLKPSSRVIILCVFWGIMQQFVALGQQKTQRVIFGYSTSTVTKTFYLQSNPPPVCNNGPIAAGFSTAKLVAKLDWNPDYLNAGINNQYTANIIITPYSDFAGTEPMPPYSTSLVVSTNNPQAYVTFDFSYYYPWTKRFDAQVTYVNSGTNQPTIQDVLQTEVYYLEDILYQVNDVTSPTNITLLSAGPVDPANADKEWIFKWTNNCIPAPNYQLQLLRLFNNNATNTTEGTITTDIDWSKALTVETGNSLQELALTIAEGTGYYLWRVRAIGNNNEGGTGNDLNWGPWSGTGTVSGVNKLVTTSISPYLFFYTQFDAEKNWIFARSFIEGDAATKGQVTIGESISYANGLQMTQQQQTRKKTEGKRLVGQTIMDFSGRPALATLPAPVDKSALGYLSNYIKNNAGTAYSASNFDTDANYLNPEPIDSTAVGTGIYYSNNNNLEADVPTASGFPYSRTLFTNDGNSSPKEQSSPGLFHKLGNTGLNKHTIRNYESSVTDGELVTVFGDEAPRPESVSKLISIDANGTGTVTYNSKEGKTIATCLSSSGVTTLEALPSASGGAQTINCNLGSTNTPYGDNGVRSTKTIVLTQGATLNFTYKITPNAYQDICANFCATCDYKVTVKITDNDNPSVPININGSPIYTVATIAPTTGTPGCTATERIGTIPAVTLTAGSYTIERIIEANQINTAVSPPAPAVANTAYLEQYLKQQEAALFTKFQSATNVTATVIDGLGATVATKPNISMNTVTAYLYNPTPPVDITTVPYQPDLNGLYTYLGVLPPYTKPTGGPETVGVKVKLTFDNCSSIFIPVIACDSSKCPTPIAGLYKFEKYFTDWYKARNPFATGVTINTLFNGYPFVFSPGDFDIIVSNMINGSPSTAGYDKDELFNNWKAVFMSTGSPATIDLSTTTVDNQSMGGLNSNKLLYKNNYLDMFISGAMYKIAGTKRYGYQIQGINNNPGGYGSANLGYKFHPHAYIQYSPTCESCERAYLAEAKGCNNPIYSQCIMAADFTTLFNGDPITKVVGTTTLYPKNDFFQCISHIHPQDCGVLQTPNTTTLSANFSLNIIDTCKKMCEERRQVFVSAIKDTYNKAGKYVEGDIYGLSVSVVNPSIYVFNNSSHTYVPGTDIAKSAIYCETQSVVDACKNMCTLTVNGSTGEVGTPTQQATIGNIMTGYFDFKLPTSGSTCVAGYTSTPNSTQTITRASTINNLNQQLEIERAKAASNGTYWSYVDFLKGINNAAVVNNCTSQQGFVFVHPDIPSYFEYDSIASKIVYYFNKVKSGSITQKRLTSLPPAIVSSQFIYTPAPGLDEAEDVVFSECGVKAYILNSTFTPHVQGTTLPSGGNFKEIGNALMEGTFNGAPFLNNTSVVEYDPNNISNCATSSYWKIPLCATINSTSILCPSICYKLMPAAEVKTTDAFFKTQGTYFHPVSCLQSGAQEVLASMAQQIGTLIQDQNNRLRTQYRQKCIDQVSDEFKTTYSVNYYHYTLYYYDRAGNLVKTVPPHGVVKGAADRSVHPAHKIVTEYAYNSLSQVVRQTSPDGGETKFWYDLKSQLRFSQNQQQRTEGKMAYTKYDELGRVVETGLMVQTLAPTAIQLADGNYPAAGTGTDITVTVYSTPDQVATSGQNFLQNRVSYTYTDKGGDINTTTDQVKTFYSYDPSGNVEWVQQNIPEIGQRIINYEYDLISGNVIKVRMGDFHTDNFCHRYSYDADKRIKTVETSKDNIIWEKDASYSYYLHGPLKRTEIGQDKVQGLDYTYTIQGWLKGLNHLESPYDPGKDGNSSGNTYVAKDVYSMNLGYYDGDFISKSSPTNASASNPNYVTSSLNLYNGNIKTWTSNYDYPSIQGGGTLQDYGSATGRIFKYDELNRIREAQYATQNPTTRAWTKHSAYAKYFEAFTYDANGNIKTAKRRGGNGQIWDSLSYQYTATPFNNRLLWVDELAPVTSDQTDIEDQSTGNYGYDLAGNIIKDTKEGINAIGWNAYGKISTVTKADGTQLSFLYDAAGNRVYKKSYKSTAPLLTKTSYYFRDASGNPLSIYERSIPNSTTERYDLKEQPIYGSSRIGERKPGGSIFIEGYIPNADAVGEIPEFPGIDFGLVYNRTLNQKNYEITDHLGNVHAVIADYKVAAAGANTMWNKRFDNNTTEGFAVAPGSPGTPTVTNVNGQLRINGTLGASAKISLNTTTLPTGNRYSLSFDYYRGNIALASYSIAANPVNNALAIIGNLTSNGRQTIVFDVPASGVSTTDLFFKCEGTGDFFIDNILIKKVSSTLVDPVVLFTDNFNGQAVGWSKWAATGATLSYAVVTANVDYKLKATNTGTSATLSKKVALIPGLIYKITFKLDVTAIGTSGSPKLMFEYYDNDNNNSDYRAFIRNTNGASPGAPGYTYYFTPRTPDGTVSIKWESGASTTFNFAVDDVILTQMENKSLPLFTAVVKSMADYTAFGAQMVGRNILPENYRYGFNGKEKDDEVKNIVGSSYDFGARMYDPRLGRWLSVDPLARKFTSMSPYCAMGNNPLIFTDPDGREIIGVTEKDAKKFKADIQLVLADKKFEKVRALIDVKGSKFKSINVNTLSTALEGVDLTDDERAYVDIVTNTINSKDVHKIEYLTEAKTSSEGATAFKDYMNGVEKGVGDLMVPEGELNTKLIEGLGKEGLNVPTKKGSHSFISSSVEGNDRASTSGHELFGHGIPSGKGLSRSDNNANAIRTDNLIRRILGMNQRDGKDHAGYKEGDISEPQKLPLTK